MAIYTFINGQREHIFKWNPRVCVNGSIKKIVGGYTFINGERKTLFTEWSFETQKLFDTTGWTTVTLPFGSYQVFCRGGGGAGGQHAQYRQDQNYGSGGAGGKGEYTIMDFTVTNSHETHSLYVGWDGHFNDSYSNGGAANGNSINNYSGCGGGGGGPTAYFTGFEEGKPYCIAQGGGGGGGGGAGAGYGRYSHAGSGGGGGGYFRGYKANNTLEWANYPGKQGGLGGGINDVGGQGGWTGNTEHFPNIVSGRGGRGGYSDGASSGWGGAEAWGGGASGGGGGAGKGNHSTSYGGGGGGGAGGCYDAGGGQRGKGIEKYSASTDGYNFHNVPTDLTNTNTAWGAPATLGRGGYPEQAGTRGFVVLKRIG